VSRYGQESGIIGMHGGLPPPSTFPFTDVRCGLLDLGTPGSTHDAAAAGAAGHSSSSVLDISDPQLVAAAQQYNMSAQVREGGVEGAEVCTRPAGTCMAAWSSLPGPPSPRTLSWHADIRAMRRWWRGRATSW
jgi:hypothetical protein